MTGINIGDYISSFIFAQNIIVYYKKYGIDLNLDY